MGIPAPRKKSKIPAPSSASSADSVVAKQLSDLAGMIERGAVDYSFQKQGNRVTFTVDSPDGTQRMIRESNATTGLVRETTEVATKLPLLQRRNLVKTLVDDGLTQLEISKRTMTSQKTVSNDIAALRDKGRL